MESKLYNHSHNDGADQIQLSVYDVVLGFRARLKMLLSVFAISFSLSFWGLYGQATYSGEIEITFLPDMLGCSETIDCSNFMIDAISLASSRFYNQEQVTLYLNKIFEQSDTELNNTETANILFNLFKDPSFKIWYNSPNGYFSVESTSIEFIQEVLPTVARVFQAGVKRTYADNLTNEIQLLSQVGPLEGAELVQLQVLQSRLERLQEEDIIYVSDEVDTWRSSYSIFDVAAISLAVAFLISFAAVFTKHVFDRVLYDRGLIEQTFGPVLRRHTARSASNLGVNAAVASISAEIFGLKAPTVILFCNYLQDSFDPLLHIEEMTLCLGENLSSVRVVGLTRSVNHFALHEYQYKSGKFHAYSEIAPTSFKQLEASILGNSRSHERTYVLIDNVYDADLLVSILKNRVSLMLLSIGKSGLAASIARQLTITLSQYHVKLCTIFVK